MVEAIKKYKATPMISIAVVTKGPVDIAGSKLSFFRIIGTLAPTAVAIVIEQNMLNPITRPRLFIEVPVIYSEARPTNKPYVAPNKLPTITSLKINGKVFVTSTLPVASPLTTMVEDCVPTLPPIPIITGINAAKTIICSNRLLK